MRKRVYRASLVLLLIAALLIGTCWFYAEQLLDSFARPQIEQLATRQLAARVRIGQLGWTDSGLEIHALQIEAPKQFLLNIPHATVDFTLASLWQRRLDALHIATPKLTIFPAPKTDPVSKAPPKFPDKLPLTIDRLTLADGQLLLHLPVQQLELHELNFSGALQPKSNFQLTALFGTDNKHPLAISGRTELSPRQTLTLQTISWQNQQLLSAPLAIQLDETGLAPGSSGLRLEQFDHKKLQALLSALGQPAVLPESLEFSLSAATLDVAMQDQALQLELQVETGRIGWNQLGVDLSDLKLQLAQQPDGWQVTGQFQGPALATLTFAALLGSNQQLTGQAELQIPNPDTLQNTVFGGPAGQISGALQLAAVYSLQGDQFQLETNIQGSSTGSGKDYLLNLSQLTGLAELHLSDGKQDLSLNLQLASRPLLSVEGNFQQFKFALAPQALNDIKLLLPPEKIPTQIQGLSGLKATGQMNRDMAGWAGDIELSSSRLLLPELAINALVGRTKLQLTAEQINFAETTINAGIARGAELTTQLQVQCFGDYAPQSFSLTLHKLTLAQLNYMSADGQTGVGEAGLDLQGQINGHGTEAPLTLELKGTLAIKELLLGAFYADLSRYPGDFTLSGQLSPHAGTLDINPLKVSLPQLGTLTTTGLLSAEQIELQTRIELTELSSSYGKQLRPLLSTSHPALAELTLAGALALDTTLLWHPGDWQAVSKLNLQGLDAVWDRYRLAISGATGVIPFAYRAGPTLAGTESETEQGGELSFRSLAAGLATLEQGQLQLTAAPNRFSCRSPLLLQLAGGRVAINNLTLAWPDDKLQGTVKIKVAEVELETLTKELGLPVMQGRLSADLGTIRYAEQRLSTDGLANIEVFGGRFQLQNMRYSEPFSSYPTFHADIDFTNLDLLQATKTFDFGEMNGLLDGYVHGLELFGTTPAAFEAALATRTEGKRNISVKALNNLSILSQGGISAALSRGVYRFIDFYRYQKIGFKCSLVNDTFTLLGTARSDSNNYLVYGGLLPPRIDITTSTPTISFKEMMNRLGRIQRAGH